jgi:endo-1,4-beta-xylanase
MPKLLYSDTRNIASDPYNGRNTELTLKFMDMLKTEELVDGIAVQEHIGASNPPDKSDMIKTLQAYGLPIYITECDVSLVKNGGSQEKRYNLQADIYRSIVEEALDSGVCKSITFWDTGDKYSWLEQPEFQNHLLGGPDADPTLFDEQLKPKPAYFAVQNVLKACLSKHA